LPNANAERGEVAIPGLGLLHYDWDAIARLIDAFGQDFDSTISEAMVKNDMTAIATAVAIGLGPTVTPDEVKAVSPPIVPTVNAVMVALNLSFHGEPTGAPHDEAEPNPTTRKARRATSSRKRSK